MKDPAVVALIAIFLICVGMASQWPKASAPIALDLRKPSEVFTSLVRKIDNIQLEFRVWNCSQKLARAFCPNLKCDEVEIGTNELLLCVASGEAYKLPTEK